MFNMKIDKNIWYNYDFDNYDFNDFYDVYKKCVYMLY